MKRLLLILSSLALAAGCVEPNSILLLNAEVLDDTCTPTGDQIYAGTVMAGTSNYYAAFEVQSELSADDITVNGSIVNPASRNDYVASTAVLDYFNAAGASLGIPTQHIAMSTIVPAGASAGESWIVLNLLNATVASSIATVGQVAVQVYLQGRLLSGNTILETNRVQFPLTVYSGGTCVGPADAPCGNTSQDIVCN